MIKEGKNSSVQGTVTLLDEDCDESFVLERVYNEFIKIFNQFEFGKDVFEVAYRIDIFWQDVDVGKIVKGQFDAPLYVSDDLGDAKKVFDRIADKYKTYMLMRTYLFVN